MTGKALWQNLKKLVELDTQIRQLQENKSKKTAAIETAKQTINELEQTAEQLKVRFTEAKKEADLLQLQSTHLKEQEEHKKELLDSVQDEREYKAIERERTHLARKRSDNDNLVMKSWANVEEWQKKYDAAAESYESSVSAQDEIIISKETEIAQISADIEKLMVERNEQAQHVPADWTTRYDRMKENVADPIVQVVNSSCGSCYYNILRQDLSRLKKQGILPCRNCYRFLYYEEAEQPQENSASY